MGTVSMRKKLFAFAGAAVRGAAVLSVPQRAPAGEVVQFDSGHSPGTIVVVTHQRRLYYVLGHGQAIRYPVGVGRAGKQWAGITRVDGKYIRPAWSPPAEMRRDKPSLPHVIPGGSPRNPMGVAALTLAGGQYAIHGPNSPRSIGGFVSFRRHPLYKQESHHPHPRLRRRAPAGVG